MLFKYSGGSGTLQQLYPNIDVTIGFPDNFEVISLPTIALMEMSSPANDHLTNEWIEKQYNYKIDTFAGGERTNGVIDTGKNRYMKGRLATDIKTLLDNNSITNHIDYYNFTDLVASGTMYRGNETIEVSNVTLTPLEPTGDLEADRYRSTIDFTVSLITSQD